MTQPSDPPDPPAGDLYSIYGLRVALIGATSRLPAVAGLGPADVTIHLGGFPASIPVAPAELLYGRVGKESGHRVGLRIFRVTASPYLHFRFPDDTEFLVNPETSTLYANWPEFYSLGYVAPILLGPLMGFLLRLKGITTLHASVIASRGRAVALTGPGGTGKSTTAAAFARAGFAVLSDDLAPLRPENNLLQVAPGYPRVCLWPESVRLLFGNEEALPLITEGWDKRFLDLAAPGYQFGAAPLPLGAVYWISERAESAQPPRIEPLNPQQALAVLVGNTYAAKFGDLAGSARDLRIYSDLISRLPVRRVYPGSGCG